MHPLVQQKTNKIGMTICAKKVQVNATCPVCNVTRITTFESINKWLYRHKGQTIHDYFKQPCLNCRAKTWDNIKKAIATLKPYKIGERTFSSYGYILYRMEDSDPLICMTPKNERGWIKEHRYVMAKSLGRPLESWEIIHHIDGNKSNNKLENLELVSSNNIHLSMGQLINEVEKLRKENKKLKEIINDK